MHVHLQYVSDLVTPMHAPLPVCDMLRTGIFALVGSHTVETADIYRLFTSTFMVPFITVGIPLVASSGGLRMDYGVYMTPVYTQAMMDIIRHYGWTKIQYVYNTLEGKR